MITGNCLCGAVKWQVDGEIDRMTHCHCSMCRKAHGAAFGTYASAAAEKFSLVSGKDAIVTYESSPGFTRAFCGACGSVVPFTGAKGNVAMPAGCLNEDPGIRPQAHIFATQKAPWHEIADDLPQHDGYITPGQGPNIDRPGPDAGKAGVLRGSCLCGDVAYEVSTPFKVVYNCHCSRCRKARAAAHTTNGFTAMDGVTFLRGEDQLKSYKPPDAKMFTHVFCARCGSGMPRLNPDMNVAAIPFGSLDDDPGRGIDSHIFTGSMAPWYEIADDVPQREEGPG